MNISITIMAHPKRRKQANALLVKLAQYPFIQCYITWDRKNSEWDTGERALRAGIKAGGAWHVVLQDDAIICPDFYNNLVGALNNVPVKTLVSLYTGTARPLGERVAYAVGQAKGISWLRFNTLLWGVGIALPTQHIADLLESIADRPDVYDTRIGAGYQQQRLPVFYTNPSLVDHDNDLGSILKKSANVPAAEYEKTPRVAHNFADSRPVRWNNGVVDI
jgi:hypothetical protein